MQPLATADPFLTRDIYSLLEALKVELNLGEQIPGSLNFKFIPLSGHIRFEMMQLAAFPEKCGGPFRILILSLFIGNMNVVQIVLNLIRAKFDITANLVKFSYLKTTVAAVEENMVVLFSLLRLG